MKPPLAQGRTRSRACTCSRRLPRRMAPLYSGASDHGVRRRLWSQERHTRWETCPSDSSLDARLQHESSKWLHLSHALLSRSSRRRIFGPHQQETYQTGYLSPVAGNKSSSSSANVGYSESHDLGKVSWTHLCPCVVNACSKVNHFLQH